MPFNQDDQRERAMVAALNLNTRPDRVRHEEDAFMDVQSNGHTYHLLFECKSSPVDTSFGTSRDTGLQKLMQWTDYHFAFGWFDPRDNLPIRMWYGSPRMMRDWLDKEKEYLQSDLLLCDIVPSRVDDDIVTQLFGSGTVFTYDQIYRVMKDQWNAKASEGRPNLYKEYADIQRARRTTDNQYSRAIALRAAKDRTEYLLRRGSTVNNRKISSRYVIDNCKELERTAWARSLDVAVREEITLGLPSNPAQPDG
jgi:hypothetical protein